mmetsp:Transcript_34940/g.51206  ORF Transcript_34940/g.51206 Transcript_34940/m.51206 type:complete len:301 (-) Transcript_34940:323-1225(-)
MSMRLLTPQFLFIVISMLAIASMSTATPDDVTGDHQPLKVIYAGFGRCGTMSLSEALTRLGYKATHGSITAKNLKGSHAELGNALMAGDVEQILSATSQLGYNATTTSNNIFWLEMMERTPDAKIIFMTRDFDSWFDSLLLLLIEMGSLSRFPLKFIPSIYSVSRYTVELTKRTFESEYNIDQIKEIVKNPNGALTRKAYKKLYDDYISDMERILAEQPNRSFLFHKEDGYPSLCQFLEISDEDCPNDDEPFPHSNNASNVKKQGKMFRIMEVVAYAFLFVIMKLSFSFGPKKHGKKKNE